MLRLRTFGGIALERDGRPLEGPASQRRRLALLVYLAAAGDRPMPREKLIALLWPERDGERGRHSLSQLLYSLRADLGAGALVGGMDEVRLDPSRVGSDLTEFREAVAQRKWEVASELYRGPFLDGFFLHDAPGFEQWLEEERQRLARVAGRALEALAADASGSGNAAASVAAWRRRAALDPLDSRVALRLMESLAAGGDRGGALRHARLHAELLGSELEATPDSDVEAFATRLRSRVSPPPAPSPLPPAPVAEEYPAAPPEARPRPRRRSLRFGLLAVALASVAFGVQSAFLTPGGVSPIVRPMILLGGVFGADSGLALAVQEALRTELAADRRLRVLPEGRAEHTLRLMQIGSGLPSGPPVLLEMAQRDGAHFAVAGAVTSAGSGLRLELQAFDPISGASLYLMRTDQVRPGEVVSAVARLGRELAARLAGTEPDTTVQPLPAVTTGSLPALKAYALARQAHARGDRVAALSLGEGALAHDTLFPLAHHLVGDLLWFFDQQKHAEAHWARAYQGSAGLPLRERLIVRARYEQIVGDRPDSALALWQALLTSFPDEILGYEGMAWTLRALERFSWAAAVADTALRLDPTARIPHANNRLYSLLSTGDTAAALAFASSLQPRWASHLLEARYVAALVRRDWGSALEWVDSSFPVRSAERNLSLRAYRRHIALAAGGRRDEARRELEEIRAYGLSDLTLPRSLLVQAILESEAGRSSRAAELAREAFEWTGQADLSPPGLARLTERAALTAAWVGDTALIEAAARLLTARDAGRGLRSYRSAGRAVEGARAFARGQYPAAAALLRRARSESYFSRSVSTLGLLEADARARAGDQPAAAALYRGIASYRLPDGDFEAWPILGVTAANRLTESRLPTDR